MSPHKRVRVAPSQRAFATVLGAGDVRFAPQLPHAPRVQKNHSPCDTAAPLPRDTTLWPPLEEITLSGNVWPTY